MPCHDPRDHSASVRMEYDFQDRINSLEKRYKGLLDNATRAACEAISYLEAEHGQKAVKDALTLGSRKWWKEHVELDKRREEEERRQKERAEREAQEELRKRDLVDSIRGKLTDEELETLGL